MKEKLFFVLGVLAFIFLVAGSVAVEYDKDLSACVSDFEFEVKEIEEREFAMALAIGGNEIYADEIKNVGENFPYDRSLDRIIEQRDAILKEKSVLMLGSWWTIPRGGMREVSTLSIYIPLKPWKLRYS